MADEFELIHGIYSILDYASLGLKVSKLNSCNNCEVRRNCEHLPEWGDSVRFNCPLWKGDKND